MPKKKIHNSQNSGSPIVFTHIFSQINEIYSKIKIEQKFLYLCPNPLELQIYVNKKKGVIFSSFTAKIGDSIMVKSKVIKKKKPNKNILTQLHREMPQFLYQKTHIMKIE